VKISSPVKVASDSPHRVALDLAMQISYAEKGQQDRRYWLTLYRQCYKAVNGHQLESILKAE
jgi:hypothetical protein